MSWGVASVGFSARVLDNKHPKVIPAFWATRHDDCTTEMLEVEVRVSKVY